MKYLQLKSLSKMTLFLCFIGLGVLLFIKQFLFIYSANITFNSLILGVLAFGIVRLFASLKKLSPETEWLNHFLENKKQPATSPVLLSPVAKILKGHEGKSRPYLPAGTLQSILDMIDSRLSDDKEMARYFINVLIFLGLLGTFFGLMQTIQSISGVIQNLSINVADFDLMFRTLKTDLSAPLYGMATAFSSSLIGLSSSLVLGYLTLQVNHAQNRFYNETEEKLSALTRISGDILGVKKGEESIFSYLQALLEQTADSMNKLELSLARSEHHHQKSAMQTTEMSQQLMILSKQMYKDLGSMEKMAMSYQSMLPLVEKLRDLSQNMGIDSETKSGILSINTNLKDMSQQLSSDLKILAKTVSINGKSKAKK
ncbi:MAG: MotA/TolQ/ExbB proton channel family protein [Alphaproteobacteria bacterium]|nr:MotA/TolQ/ExbB proton channel family protein [Alphaproteobacteria bacterium]